MAYRIRYTVCVDWVPAGLGQGQVLQVQNMPGMNGGPAQTLQFFDTTQPNSATFTATDITNLLTTMTNDISAQMNAAATLARVQAFSTGGS